MRYCSSIHTARERDCTRSMLMIEAEGWTFPLESIVPSNTRRDLVCIGGNAGHTRGTRRHGLVYNKNFKGSPTYVAT